VSRIALLTQEGSTIETAVEIVRGVVPEPSSIRMHSETFRLRNHPSRHRKVRDDAALLTQEGNSRAFPVSIILCAELIWTAVPGQEGWTRAKRADRVVGLDRDICLSNLSHHPVCAFGAATPPVPEGQSHFSFQTGPLRPVAMGLYTGCRSLHV
jgi:hypothetical protein